MSKIFDALSRTHSDIPGLIGSAPEVPAAVLPQETPSTVYNPEMDALASGEPVAGGSPLANTAAGATAVMAPGSRTLPICIAPSAPLLPFDGAHRFASEQYRIVRTKILQHPSRPRFVVVSSPGSGDGKTVTATNLAGALSLKAGASVLLVDADLRRPAIHVQLELPAEPGLADVLHGQCSLDGALIQVQQFPSLYVLTSGVNKTNPTELLDSSVWTSLCSKLRERFQFIIVDSPPIAAVADYELIQAACDGVVLVVRPDHTPRKLCQKALGMVPKDRLIGVVMNSVEDWALGRRYPYYADYADQSLGN